MFKTIRNLFNLKATVSAQNEELQETRHELAEIRAEFNKQLRAATSAREHHAIEVEALEKMVTKLTAPIKTNVLTCIDFTATLPDGYCHRTTFKLGEGPCGKTVEALDVKRECGMMYITQYHTDHSHKVFEYKDSDLVGRVVMTHELLKLEPGTRYMEMVRNRIDFEKKRKWMEAGRGRVVSRR